MISAPVLRELRRGSIEALLMRVAGAVSIFTMHAVLARLLGPAEFGLFNYAISWGLVLAVLTGLGWPNAAVRFISEYTEHAQWTVLKDFLTRAHVVSLLSSAIVAGLILVAANTRMLPSQFVDSAMLVALLVPVVTLIGLRKRVLQALKHVKASIGVDDLAVPAGVVAAALVFSISTASTAVFIYVIASGVAFFATMVWFWQTLPLSGGERPAQIPTGRWMAAALPMMIGEFFQLVMTRGDVLVLGVYASMTDIGIYSAASRVAGTNFFILGSINVIAMPLLAQAYQRRQFGEFAGIYRRVSLWSAAGALPLFLVMEFAPEVLLQLFGSSFSEGTTLLRILAIGQFVNALTGPGASALMVAAGERFFAVSTIWGALLGTLVLFPMCSKFGVTGAAVTVTVLVSCLNALWAWRALHLNKTRLVNG